MQIINTLNDDFFYFLKKSVVQKHNSQDIFRGSTLKLSLFIDISGGVCYNIYWIILQGKHMKFKVLIFDLDGTIADTIYGIRDGVNLAMDMYGLPRRDYQEVRAAIGNGSRELIRLSIPEDRREESFIDKVHADYNRLYEGTYAKLDGCYPYMSEALHALHARGYALAVHSNKQDIYVKKIIEMLFPDGIISFAAGQTDLPKKPNPTVPLMIAKIFGAVPAECAFIGDSEVDIATAKNAGMYSVACAWGYRPREALIGADKIIDSASELDGIFE